MNAIDSVFQRLQASRRKAFIPFITAGDPDLATTLKIVNTLAALGASIVEIGFPYSDPIADGSVIQASYTRACKKACAWTISSRLSKTPRKQVPRAECRWWPWFLIAWYTTAGPPGLSARRWARVLAAPSFLICPWKRQQRLPNYVPREDFKLIQLVTPTTTRERAQRIAQLSSGFLYCVSVVGITGARAVIPPQLLEQLKWFRSQTKLPLCVGFGISKPEHVQQLRDAADGIIVGSALVRHLGEIGPKSTEEVLRALAAQAAELISARSTVPLKSNGPGITAVGYTATGSPAVAGSAPRAAVVCQQGGWSSSWAERCRRRAAA